MIIKEGITGYEEPIKVGDIVDTPRFLDVEIKEVFNSESEARRAGYVNTTDYTLHEPHEYNIYGKSLDMYHMEFAAFPVTTYTFLQMKYNKENFICNEFIKYARDNYGIILEYDQAKEILEDGDTRFDINGNVIGDYVLPDYWETDWLDAWE